MAKFFCCDHHFGHTKQFTAYGRKGIFSSNEEMTEHIIARHNSVVKKQDIVYFVGDFTFASFDLSKKILSRLNGQRKILIQGNHCLSEKRHISVSEYLDMGFDDVIQEKIITLSNGEDVLLKHYPYQKGRLQNLWMDLKDFFRPEDQKRFKKYHAYYPCDRGLWLIHGHIHKGPKRIGKQINVNVETWDYKPVSESQICKLMTEFNEGKILRKLSHIRNRLVGLVKSLTPQKSTKIDPSARIEKIVAKAQGLMVDQSRKYLCVGYSALDCELKSLGLVNTLITGDCDEKNAITALTALGIFKSLDQDNHHIKVIELGRATDEFSFLSVAGHISRHQYQANDEGYKYLVDAVDAMHEQLAFGLTGKRDRARKDLLVISGIDRLDVMSLSLDESDRTTFFKKLLEVMETGGKYGIAIMGISSKDISNIPTDIFKKLFVKIIHEQPEDAKTLLFAKRDQELLNRHPAMKRNFVLNGQLVHPLLGEEVPVRELQQAILKILLPVNKKSRHD